MGSKRKFFHAMKDVLPCKFCRQSTNEFSDEIPMTSNLAFWLYRLHNRVNKKLHDQHLLDKTIIDPEPNPSFEEVRSKYVSMLKQKNPNIPGRDFLLSVAYNYDSSLHKNANVEFWNELPKLFPFYEFRKHMFVPNLLDNKSYFKDVHHMFRQMGDTEALEHAWSRVSKYKSKCKHGKTCRTGSSRRRKTHRIISPNLLL